MLEMSQNLPGFFPTAPRTRLVAGLLIADVTLGSLNGVVSHCFTRSMTERGLHNDPAAVLASAGVIMLLSLLSLGAMVTTITLFCMWVHRAFYNLYPLRIRVNTSPGWAVGSFFVPFVNLVVPYLAIKELMVASNAPIDCDQAYTAPQDAPLVGWWWFTYLGSGFVATIGGFMNLFAQMDHRSPPEGALVPLLASQALRILSAVLLIKILYWVDQRQLHRATLMTAAPPSDGPFRGPTA